MITYVRNNWGNGAAAVSAGQVAKVRERTSPSGWPILTAER